MEVSRRMVASLVAVAGPKIVVAGGGEEAGEEMEVEVYEEEEEEEEAAVRRHRLRLRLRLR